MLAGQSLVLLDAQQDMGGLAAIGDEYRTVPGRLLGSANVLIELAADKVVMVMGTSCERSM
ncbi:hypothetical protein [Halomonas sp. BM-2019]|uniref:hypothetical protein n=1 Tax=Halomonas sp. BM-2019 TaxID=2811227 RepID=UPI0031FBFABF